MLPEEMPFYSVVSSTTGNTLIHSEGKRATVIFVCDTLELPFDTLEIFGRLQLGQKFDQNFTQRKDCMQSLTEGVVLGLSSA